MNITRRNALLGSVAAVALPLPAIAKENPDAEIEAAFEHYKAVSAHYSEMDRRVDQMELELLGPRNDPVQPEEKKEPIYPDQPDFAWRLSPEGEAEYSAWVSKTKAYNEERNARRALFPELVEAQLEVEAHLDGPVYDAQRAVEAIPATTMRGLLLKIHAFMLDPNLDPEELRKEAVIMDLPAFLIDDLLRIAGRA